MFEILQELLEDSTFKSKVKYSSRQFKANEKILEQGKPHTSIYLIKAGKVRVVVHAEDIEASPMRPGIADLGVHDIFGEFGLFDNLPASADVMALEDSELVEIDITTLRTYLDNNPKIGYKLLDVMINTLVSRLRHADKTIFTLYSWGMKAHKLDKLIE